MSDRSNRLPAGIVGGWAGAAAFSRPAITPPPSESQSKPLTVSASEPSGCVTTTSNGRAEQRDPPRHCGDAREVEHLVCITLHCITLISLYYITAETPERSSISLHYITLHSSHYITCDITAETPERSSISRTRSSRSRATPCATTGRRKPLAMGSSRLASPTSSCTHTHTHTHTRERASERESKFPHIIRRTRHSLSQLRSTAAGTPTPVFLNPFGGQARRTCILDDLNSHNNKKTLGFSLGCDVM